MNNFFFSAFVFGSSTGSHQVDGISVEHTSNGQKEWHVVHLDFVGDILRLVEPIHSAVSAAADRDKVSSIENGRDQEVKNQGGDAQTFAELCEFECGLADWRECSSSSTESSRSSLGKTTKGSTETSSASSSGIGTGTSSCQSSCSTSVSESGSSLKSRKRIRIQSSIDSRNLNSGGDKSTETSSSSSSIKGLSSTT